MIPNETPVCILEGDEASLLLISLAVIKQFKPLGNQDDFDFWIVNNLRAEEWQSCSALSFMAFLDKTSDTDISEKHWTTCYA